jgi:2-hydroxy-3-oxopropionate reductase
MKIAFIGLGHMGGPMARNLLKAGHSLIVFDVIRHNVDALTAVGAAAAASAKLAALQAELVITMLPSSPHV